MEVPFVNPNTRPKVVLVTDHRSLRLHSDYTSLSLSFSLSRCGTSVKITAVLSASIHTHAHTIILLIQHSLSLSVHHSSPPRCICPLLHEVSYHASSSPLSQPLLLYHSRLPPPKQSMPTMNAVSLHPRTLKTGQDWPVDSRRSW